MSKFEKSLYHLVLVAFVYFVLGTHLSAQGKYKLVEEEHLSIYAKRHSDIDFFQELIPRIKRESTYFLPPLPENFHLLIRLSYHDGSRKKQYIVRIKSAKSATIDISWGAHTQMEDVIRSYLELQIKHWIDREKIHLSKTPQWLLEGITQNVLIAMNQTSWHRQPDDRISSRFVPLAKLFTEDSNSVASAFFVNWLDDLLPTKTDLANFISATLRGRDPLMSLSRELPEAPESLDELELSWRLGFYRQLQSRDTAYWTLEESLNKINELNQWLLPIDDRIQKIPLDELPNYKEIEQLSSLTKQRILLTKAYLDKINPAYYNTLWAFGRSLEELLKKEGDFLEAVNIFNNDRESSILLHQEARKLVPLSPLP